MDIQTCRFGWIDAPESARDQLENLGITLGRHTGQDFINCIVPQAALERMDGLWGTYTWGLADEVEFDASKAPGELSYQQLLAARGYWQGLINGPENDGRLTATSSASLDYWMDRVEEVNTEILKRDQNPENTRFEYQYRDGGNHKKASAIVLIGASTPTQAIRLSATLDDHDGFIAHQVRAPELFHFLDGGSPYHEDIDHCWHSVSDVDSPFVPTNEDATDHRTVEDFVATFERANAQGWELFDPAERFPDIKLANENDERPGP